MLIAIAITSLFGCSARPVGPLSEWCHHQDAMLRANPDHSCPTQKKAVPKPIGKCGALDWAMIPEQTDGASSNHFFFDQGQLVGVSLIGPSTSGTTPFYGVRPRACEPCLYQPRSRLPTMSLCDEG